MYPIPRKRIIIVFFVVSVALVLWYCFSLPRRLFEDAYSATVWSREGELLSAKIAPDGQWRFFPTEDVPDKFKTAITVYEDKRFDYHWGVDPLSLARAVRQNVMSRRNVSGASTLTMQTIRLSRKNRGRTLGEKLIEMILATRLEFRCKKEEILQLYAAHAPFGGNVVGLESASWYYFGCRASELSWAESATLAVLPNAPSLIHLKRNRERLKAKRDQLLDKIYRAGYMDSITCALAKQEWLADAPERFPMDAPHLLGRMQGGALRSTLDANLQRRVSDVAARFNAQYRGNKINNLAILVADVHTGEVLAYVGNVYNWQDKTHGTSVDVITAPRSSGSVLKPILYAAMLDNGTALPTMLFPDIPTYFKDFTPQNFDKTFDGAAPADKVIERSLNVPSVRMLDKYGRESFLKLLQNLSFTTLRKGADHYGLSLILGGAEITLWDLVSAYSAMAGKLNPADTVYAMHYQAGNKNRIEKERIPLSRGAIWQMFEVISQLTRPEEEEQWQYFSSPVRIGWKTGTSYGNRDAWAVGATPDYAIGVWVGNCSGEGRPLMTGVSYAAPVLFDVLRLLPAKGEWFPTPYDELEPVVICRQSGFQASHICPDKDTILTPLTVAAAQVCPYHRMVNLSADLQYRVTADCYDPSRMVHRAMFILPSVQEWYYKKKHAEYQPLPPMYPDAIDVSDYNPIDLIYPRNGREVLIPRSLEGDLQNVVFSAVHSERNGVIFWHLDDTYVGATTLEHKLSLRPAPGSHRLTISDENGYQRSIRFTCR